MSRFIKLSVSALIFLGISVPGFSAGKKAPNPVSSQAPSVGQGRRVLLVNPVRNVRIQLPDDKLRDFGVDFDGAVGHYLANHPSFILARSEHSKSTAEGGSKSTPKLTRGGDDYEWSGSVLPAANITFHVDAFSLVTGFKGGRMFYGFDERFRTEFNDGTESVVNEFPLIIPFNYPNWFDRTFDEKGSWPTSSTSGLDLGEGFRLDSLFAYLNVKYATYHSSLQLRIEVDSPLSGRHDFRTVHVKGSGFFYDVVGGYVNWQGGIGVARNAAMFDAFNRAVAAAVQAIDRAASNLPLTALVDFIKQDGLIFLGTGISANVPAGTLYQAVENENLVFRVETSYLSGSVARLVKGAFNEVKTGMALRQIQSVGGGGVLKGSGKIADSGAPSQSTFEVIELPVRNLSEPNLNGVVTKISRWKAFLKSLVENVFLPYRIWRYDQYDQAYLRNARLADETDSPDRQMNPIQNTQDWAREVLNQPWAMEYDLFRKQMSSEDVTVAIIDTGIDYNHPVVHDQLWFNPAPTEDVAGQKDRYGWDFISGDSRPYDDAYHGTQMAGAVLAVAPKARLMPLKIFNPWGVTNSAAVLSAFSYAVDHGAKYILCGWATRKYSKAMEMGIAYARDHGVPVIVAAGDLGLDLAKVPAYPASFAKKYANVIIVTARATSGAQWKNSNYYSGPGLVGKIVSAPGENILVPEPRGHYSRVSSSGVSAAIYTGILAAESVEPATTK